MKKLLQPYFTEKFGLPSNETIEKSAYKSKCGKK